jgi:hypothetical protein
MSESTVGEIIEGLWRFEALLPEWTEEESDEDGWEQSVAWWVIETPGGLVLVDPLVGDWEALDRLLADRGGGAGAIRTCHRHQRSIPEARNRYNAPVWWARCDSGGRAHHAFDLAVTDRDQLFDAVVVLDVERADEIALWLPRQAALVFGDAMLRTSTGQLRVCPSYVLVGGVARVSSQGWRVKTPGWRPSVGGHHVSGSSMRLTRSGPSTG